MEMSLHLSFALAVCTSPFLKAKHKEVLPECDDCKNMKKSDERSESSHVETRILARPTNCCIASMCVSNKGLLWGPSKRSAPQIRHTYSILYIYLYAFGYPISNLQ